jgi:hypothetical protein
MVSEAVGTLSGPAIYYRRIDPQAVQQGQATAHARVHSIAASDDRYCGLLAWSGFDYPSGSGNQYQGVKYTGVVDLFRIPKPGAAIYQAQADPNRTPVIAPAFYWDFGTTSPVTSLPSAMICSNLDRLEVYVGGQHFATVLPDTADYGYLDYPPSFVDFGAVDGSSLPELRIDGYLGEAKVATRSLAADPADDMLSLTADDAEIDGDGVDTTRLAFRVTDRYGAPRPYITGPVTFDIAGPAVLIGDNPFDLTATGGAGAVWIRSLPGSPGMVTVTASHPSLGYASAGIRVRPVPQAGPPISLVEDAFPEDLVAPLAGHEGVRASYPVRDEPIVAQDVLRAEVVHLGEGLGPVQFEFAGHELDGQGDRAGGVALAVVRVADPVAELRLPPGAEQDVLERDPADHDIVGQHRGRPHLAFGVPGEQAFDASALAGRGVEIGGTFGIPAGQSLGVAGQVGG